MTGRVDFSKFTQVLTPLQDSNAKNSLSMQRDPSSFNDFVRGKSTNNPFAPGGGVPVQDKKPKLHSLDREFDELIRGDEDGQLLTTPPGFESGLVFEKKNVEKKSVDLFSSVDSELLDLWNDKEQESPVLATPAEIVKVDGPTGKDQEQEIDQLIPEVLLFLIKKG